MKYHVGDLVKVKSVKWFLYEDETDNGGLGYLNEMSKYCECWGYITRAIPAEENEENDYIADGYKVTFDIYDVSCWWYCEDAISDCIPKQDWVNETTGFEIASIYNFMKLDDKFFADVESGKNQPEEEKAATAWDIIRDMNTATYDDFMDYIGCLTLAGAMDDYSNDEIIKLYNEFIKKMTIIEPGTRVVITSDDEPAVVLGYNEDKYAYMVWSIDGLSLIDEDLIVVDHSIKARSFDLNSVLLGI